VCGVFLTVALSCFVFPIVCPLKYLLIERYLAAKTGTNLAVSDLMGSFSRRKNLLIERAFFLPLVFQ
jgi:hypothetical protein